MSIKRVGSDVWLNGRHYQIDYHVNETIYLKDVETRQSLHFEEVEFDILYKTGRLTYSNPPSRVIPDTIPVLNGKGRLPNLLENYSEADREWMKCNKYLMDCYLKKFGSSRSKSNLRAGLDLFWSPEWKKKPSIATFCRRLKRYLDTGNDIRCFMGAHANKGNKIPRLPSEIVECCERAFEVIYLNKTKGTLDLTLAQAIVYVRELNDTLPRGIAKFAIPTKSYIRAMSLKYDRYTKVARREGNDAAEHMFRNSVHGVICLRPLDRIEIDHTRLDSHVIDSDTGLPMERPWLTAVVDGFTRSFLGYWLTMDPPCQHSTAMALKMALLPKTDLLRRHKWIKSSYPQHGKFRELNLDNGMENHSHALQQLIFPLGATMTFSPRKKPWYKGRIEHAIKTLNRGVTDGKPGRTGTSIADRGGYDAKKNATMTLEIMDACILKWIVDVYHQTTHSTTGRKPTDHWNDSISQNQIPLIPDVGLLDIIVGNAEQRRLSHRGIDINNLRYNCAGLNILRKKYADSKGVIKQVTVKWNPQDLSCIHVIGQDGIAIRVPVVTTHTEYAEGLTLYKHNVCRAYSKEFLESRDDVVALAEAKIEIHRLATQKTRSKAKSKSVSTSAVRLRAKEVPQIAPSPVEAIDPIPVVRRASRKFRIEPK